jgi:rubrerythrin
MPAEVAQEIFRVLSACRSVELAMAGLYEALAELHDHDPPMARLWRKTAGEELNHAAQFSLLLESMPDAVVGTTVDSRTLDSLRLAIEATIEEYHLRSPTAREALVAAIDFEETMDRTHAHQALIFTAPRTKQLFQAMMAADRGHVAKLRAALTKLGTAKPRA